MKHYLVKDEFKKELFDRASFVLWKNKEDRDKIVSLFPELALIPSCQFGISGVFETNIRFISACQKKIISDGLFTDAEIDKFLFSLDLPRNEAFFVEI